METNWNELALEYHLRGIPPTDAFGYAQLLSMLGDLKRKSVLDYGCGTGKFTKILARDAESVMGVDSSEVMIELAWRYNRDRFFLPWHSSLLKMTVAFDIAVSSFVYCTISSEKELDRITQEIYLSLKTGGTFNILDPHPDSGGFQFTSCFREKPPQYISGTPIEVHLKGLTEPIIDYWRSKEDYIEILRKAGFLVEKISEPILDDVVSQHYFFENAIELGDEIKHPPFILIQARKP